MVSRCISFPPPMKSSTSSNNWPSDVSSEENNVNKHLSYGFFKSLQPTNPQPSLPSTSLVPTQVHKFLFQHATTVLDHFWMSHSWWQFRGKFVFFLMPCEPVRMHWSNLLCGLSPLLMPATEESPYLRRSGCSTLQLVNHGIFPTDQHAPAFGSH